MIGRMSEQQTQAPEAETLPVTRAEKIAGWVALGCLALLGLFCFDLATGGALSKRIGKVPAASTVPGEPCEDC